MLHLSSMYHSVSQQAPPCSIYCWFMRQPFTIPVISWVSCIREWAGGGGGGQWGWMDKQKWVLPTIRAHTVVLCSQQVTEMYTIHRIDPDRHQQQFGIPLILISAPQQLDRPYNEPTRFYRIGKKTSVKADIWLSITTYSMFKDSA